MKKKYSTNAAAFFGFNFIVGYAFIVGLGNSFINAGIIFFPVILIVCSIIGYFVGLSFANLSTKFSGYGGSYLYAKKTLGPKLSFVVGWAQYIQAPFVGISALAGIVWAFQNTNFFGMSINDKVFAQIAPYLFVITGICFIILIVILNLGYNSTKGSLIVLWGFKWLILFGSLIFCISRIIGLIVDGQASQIIYNLKGSGFHFTPNIESLVSSVLTFFFAFGGIEGVAAMSDDVENPKKNMRRVLLIIVISSAIFYFVYYFIFLAALGGFNGIAGNTNSNANGGSSEAPNPINQIIGLLFGAAPAALFALITTCAVLSQVANKFTSRLQNGWVNTRLLLPLAEDGWLPRSLCYVNKKGQFSKCLLVDSVITIILCVGYVLVVLLLPKYQSALANSLSIYTLIAFVQYIVTIISAIKMHRMKEIRFRKLEYVGVWVTLIFIISLIGLFFLQGILAGVADVHSSNFSNFMFQFIGYGIAIFLGMTIYFCGKIFKWKETKFPPSYTKYILINGENIPHGDYHEESILEHVIQTPISLAK